MDSRRLDRVAAALRLKIIVTTGRLAVFTPSMKRVAPYAVLGSIAIYAILFLTPPGSITKHYGASVKRSTVDEKNNDTVVTEEIDYENSTIDFDGKIAWKEI